MDFRRINDLPPYVFAEVNALKLAARRAGEDIVDLGFGNPDIASPPFVVEKLAEAAANPRNHRYSQSRGLPNLRRAVADRYERRFGVTLDPETEVINTIGAKEGLSHLMWALVQPGDIALVPEPSYPIHIYAPVLAGAEIRRIPLLEGSDAWFHHMEQAFLDSWPRPRVVLCSFPHNPTTISVDRAFWERMVEFAHRHETFIVHDFAYADVAFGEPPPSILEVDGAKDVAVELYTLTKSHSMAGWRVGFCVGNAPAVGALAKLKSYLDYGTFQPIQIAAIVALNRGDGYVGEVNEIYRHRRDVLVDGLNRAGWPVDKPDATMFVWAPMPPDHAGIGSLEFAKKLLAEAKVAVSPGIGFGESGEGYVRFALVENEERIRQAVRGIRRFLEG